MIPPGYAIALAIVISGTLLSLVPIRRPRPLGILTFLLTTVINESPVAGLYYLLISALLAFVAAPRPVVATAAAGAALLTLAAPVLWQRGAQARPALAEALAPLVHEAQHPLPWWRILLAPLPIAGWQTRVHRKVAYGPHRRHWLDVYRPRRPGSAPAPLLVHLPGGAFRSGPRSFYSRPLLHTLSRRGWVAVSISCRLRPASYTEMLDDVHRSVAWLRDHAADYGADPSRIVLAGSSSGAHLALSAAFSTHDIAGVVGLYGYYGPPGHEGSDATPAALAHPDIPAVLLVHGSNDTLTAPEAARDLAGTLRATSEQPVLHAELPGGQHSFDLLYSPRFCAVIDAVDAFGCAVTSVTRGVR